MEPDITGDEVEPHHATDRQTRRHILKAAEELFLARGYKGVSMKDIADEVHVRPAALYYHFPEGKEELFAEMLRQMIVEATEQALAALASATDFRERLTLLTQSLLAVPIDRFSMLFRDAHEHLEKQKDFLDEVGRIFAQQVAEFFQEAAQAGEITTQIPPSILALIHQGMCIALLNGKRFAAEQVQGTNATQLAEMLVSALLDGIAITTPTRE
ncbi:MAG TPA: TetR/AcrR family transcriptional regulator [Ktedonobacterales bacterium]|nr:TetR/AcrR family transcriptional regulator [Ktedonobacterales bacterium]